MLVVLLIGLGVIFVLSSVLFLTLPPPRSAKESATSIILGALALFQAFWIRRYTRSAKSPLAEGASWFVTATIGFTAAYAAMGLLLTVLFLVLYYWQNYFGGIVQSMMGLFGGILFAKRKVVGAWLICIFWLGPIWFLPSNYSYYQAQPFRWVSFAFNMALGAAIVIRFVLGADTRAWLRSRAA